MDTSWLIELVQELDDPEEAANQVMNEMVTRAKESSYPKAMKADERSVSQEKGHDWASRDLCPGAREGAKRSRDGVMVLRNHAAGSRALTLASTLASCEP